jgi:Natural resistance-associated macrophage protein
VGGPANLYVIGFAMGCTWLEVFSRYERYISILKWGSFVLLAYAAVALVVPVPWDVVFYSTFVPSFSLKTDYVVTVVAVLGTTIAPYRFFWQSSQEAEDQRVDPTAHALIDAPEQAPAEISRMRFDTYIGMGYSNAISLFIIVAGAATLHAHGVTDIQTSAQAAEALRPIAGVFTFALFAAGIIGIGLLAVPVLAASGAYALGEALGWTTGLDRKPLDAKGILRYNRDFNPHRRRHQLRRPRSNQGAVLVGGNQRRCRGSVDGDHHAHGDARRRDGRLRAAPSVVGDRVAVHRDDGGCGCDHVCDLVRVPERDVEVVTCRMVKDGMTTLDKSHP